MKIFTSNENSKYNHFENISDKILVNGFFQKSRQAKYDQL